MNKNIKLYYHKTDGGAEYLSDKFMEWEHNGKSGKEGIFEGATYIIRIDGDIEKDAEMYIKKNQTDNLNQLYELLSQYGETYYNGREPNVIAVLGFIKGHIEDEGVQNA